MTTRYAIDTSVAVPLLLRKHHDHTETARWAGPHELVFGGHAEVETLSVLTRLRPPLRMSVDTAWRSMTSGFGQTVHPRDAALSVARIASFSISGGAIWDALVALAAVDNDIVLASRDRRAIATYARVGATVEVVG